MPPYLIVRFELFKYFETMAEFIPKLPEIDRLVITLLKDRLHQKDIARMLGITQGAVASKLKKIKRRLGFLEAIKFFEVDNMEEDLKKLGFTEFIRALVKWFVKTTSQSATADILNRLFFLKGGGKMNQVKVRHRYELILKELQENTDPLAQKYYEFLVFVKKNIYMMHDLKLPQFDRT